MAFSDMMQPASRHSAFDRGPEYYVWCGSCVRGDDGMYYLYYSYWPRQLGFEGWVIASRIGCAQSERSTGPFEPVGDALPPAGRGWDRDCTHNPTVIRHGGRYYLYYMGNFGDGTFWNHRNNQRVGVAWADHPLGPWMRLEKPVMDVTPGAHDCLMTSNPTVACMPDGRFLMIYKAVSDRDELPRGGPVVCGAAFAEHPLGPFVRHDQPIFCNPEQSWSVEDPFIWQQDGRMHALVKDFSGYFTRGERNTVALFSSCDGINWQAAEPPLAYRKQVLWEDGSVTRMHLMERPQLLLDEQGRPQTLYCACAEDEQCSVTYNLAIGLRAD